MRRLAIMVMLIVTVWAGLPKPAQAHDMAYGMAHDMPMSAGCSGCIEMERETAAHSPMAHDCHHGVTCAIHGLPLEATPSDPQTGASETFRPERRAALGSALVARALPPPRS